ncbi:tetratricopeptide repeat protein [Streptomyces sp. Tu102]|uniref:tetratricopeptide repeat protein n=1 Tax=Streptomyces sp. Tu102 TaxID=2838019 RepID=UPI001BDC0857|nr:tetratricopeptide repeat protein [Streptomyces sp. Tu102]MBT1098079.1 tetratricopeptide repeat protein [Streptomyces sp. Tu102]
MTLSAPMGLRHPERPLRGRAALLEDLRQHCRERGDGRLHVLHGLSGSGKTALALELVHALQAHFGSAFASYTWWIDGRQSALFEGGIRSVARRLGLPGDVVEAEEVVDALWQRLGQAECPWLLVVDGVSDPSMLNGPGRLAAGTGWIRPHACPSGLVLVTTYDGTTDLWGSGAALHPVLPLAERDAAQVLFDHAGPNAGSWNGAVRLARRLGGLPLALRMAGSYLAEVIAMPDAFRDAEMPAEFEAFVRALDEPVGRGLNPAPVIADTWRLALDMLERRGFPYASAVLELLSGFADAPIPYALVLRVSLMDRQPDFGGMSGSDIWRTLRALAALSLIDFCPPDNAGPPAAAPEDVPDSVRVHPLIRDLSGSSHCLPLVVTLLGRACSVEEAGKPEEPHTWAAWSLLAPHALRLVELESSLDGAPFQAQVAGAGAAELAGRYLQARGLPRQAGTVFEKVLEWRMRLLGPTDPETLTAQHTLAGALHDTGELARAEAVYRSVWQSHCAARGESFPHALTARHELGRVLQDMGRLSEAEEHLSAVLEVRQRVLGNEHGHTLSARHELARVLHDLGRWEDARQNYAQVLQARRRDLGDSHPRTLTVLHNLACLAQDEGRLESALPQLRSVHAARLQILGNAHPQTLSTAYRLGCALRDAGDTPMASALLQHVHAELSSSLGDTHAHAVRAAQALLSLTAAPE